MYHYALSLYHSVLPFNLTTLYDFLVFVCGDYSIFCNHGRRYHLSYRRKLDSMMIVWTLEGDRSLNRQELPAAATIYLETSLFSNQWLSLLLGQNLEFEQLCVREIDTV